MIVGQNVSNSARTFAQSPSSFVDRFLATFLFKTCRKISMMFTSGDCGGQFSKTLTPAKNEFFVLYKAVRCPVGIARQGDDLSARRYIYPNWHFPQVWQKFQVLKLKQFFFLASSRLSFAYVSFVFVFVTIKVAVRWWSGCFKSFKDGNLRTSAMIYFQNFESWSIKYLAFGSNIKVRADN